MEKVIKRDGREELFNKDKIINAVEAAFQDIDEGSPEKAHLKAREIANFVSNIDENLTVEQIQDIVEEKLMAIATPRMLLGKISANNVHVTGASVIA